MKIIKKIYSITVFIEVILLAFFILENINNLANVEFQLLVGGAAYDFNINMYSVFAILGVLFSFVIASSLNLFGLAINETGTRMLSKLLGMASLFVLLQLGLSYYVYPFGPLGLIAQLYTLLVFLFYAIDSLNEDRDE